MPSGPRAPWRDLSRLALLGAATAAFQTLFSRAFLSAFSGNEAVLAALLAPWLLLTSLGAYLGRRGDASPARTSLALFLYGPSAALALFVAAVLPRWFPAGVAPGVLASIAIAAALLAPACVLSGLSFAWIARDEGGPAYVAECLGAALAGAALSLFVLGRVPAFAAAAGVVLLMGAASAIGAGPRGRLAAALVPAALAVALAALPIGALTLSLQGSHLAHAVETESPYASIVVARSGAEATLYENRVPIATTADTAAAEEAAHLPLALHPAPRAVLVIGVAPSGAVREVARHGVTRIDEVEGDAVLLDLVRREIPDAARANLVAADARAHLAANAAAYDAILVLAPEPTTLAHNRLFTVELFTAARGALRTGGIFAVALPGHAEQASPEARRLHSSVRRTLEAVLGPTLVLPAGRTLYVAARDAALPPAASAAATIAASLAARSIAPRHLDRAMLDEILSPRRVADADRWASLAEPVNRDLRPTTYRLALDSALAEYEDAGKGSLLVLALAVLAGALLVFDPRSRPDELAVFTSGAGSLVTQIALMVTTQIAIGALYREIGLLYAGFMVGAAAGAALGARLPATKPTILGLDLAQIAAPLALIAVLPGIGASRAFAPALTAVAGLLPGAQFAVIARRRSGGALYAADLAGAAVAALITLTFIVPALGLAGALAVAAAVKAVSSVAIALSKEPADVEERPIALTPLVPAAFLGFVVLAAGDRSHVPIYGFTFLRPYQAIAIAALLAALLAPFLQQRGEENAKTQRRKDARQQMSFCAFAPLRLCVELRIWPVLRYALLLPLAAFPLSRCYFHVPFVFCHVCPRQCVFGVMRPYLVPAALLANFGDHHFCAKVCPLGTVQTSCARARRRPARRLALLRVLRLAALAFVAIAYFLARDAHRGGVEGSGFFTTFFRNAYAPSFVVLAVAATLLVASVLVKSPFCEGLCPIGASSDLVETIVRRNRAREQAGPPTAPPVDQSGARERGATREP